MLMEDENEVVTGCNQRTSFCEDAVNAIRSSSKKNIASNFNLTDPSPQTPDQLNGIMRSVRRRLFASIAIACWYSTDLTFYDGID